ncbi:fibropellin-1-like isoform X2 [Lytechinus pictus]|uniref:fibropellin-1-like isoform X2 n=1 Tax=Lytechinus pictus TaxID=7653 RepID=UPI0030B9DDAE
MKMETYFLLTRMFLVFVQFLTGVHSDLGGLNEHSTCSDGLGLNYTLPMFEVCRERPDGNGEMVATIPKLTPLHHEHEGDQGTYPNSEGAGTAGLRRCRFPDCLSNPCQNGWCEETMIGFKCHCSEGYTGKNCENTLPTQKSTTEEADECSRNPCAKGALCSLEGDTYKCDCPLGWTGHDCDIDVNDCAKDPCRNGAECHDGLNSYTCECTNGWEGSTCDINIDDCAEEPCQNGAECHDGLNSYTCECTDGLEGLNCDVNIDDCESDPCQHDGVCLDDLNRYTCQCIGGWQGNNCENDIDECSSNPCSNQGVCINDIKRYTCRCTDGWTGSNCETDIDECSSHPCNNDGECRNELNGYSCECTEGWSGTHCEIRSACALEPCSNGGTCVEEANGYTCSCSTDFTGTNCETAFSDLCPSGWFYHGQKCYSLEESSSYGTTHDTAKTTCSSIRVDLQGDAGERQASLLFVESQEETDAISKRFLPLGGYFRRLWLNCSNMSGTWVCEKDASGTTSSYRNWYPGQPDANVGYAIIRNISNDDSTYQFKWYDRVDCYLFCYYGPRTVCQIHL